MFKTLADRGRHRLLDSLRVRNGQSLRELCQGLDMTRQSVSRHLDVLEAANLVTSLRQGRDKLHFLNPVPIRLVHDRWIDKYARGHLTPLAELKHEMEGTQMTAEGRSAKTVQITFTYGPEPRRSGPRSRSPSGRTATAAQALPTMTFVLAVPTASRQTRASKRNPRRRASHVPTSRWTPKSSRPERRKNS